jgi:hypothetical protein
MVRRMTVRALILAPFVAGILALFGGTEYAVSAAVGIGLTLLNLWIAARIIGTVADRTPQLLLPAGLGAFAFGLLLLPGIALLLRGAQVVFFPVTGFVLVGSHMLLVLWGAADGFDGTGAQGQSGSPAAAGSRR